MNTNTLRNTQKFALAAAICLTAFTMGAQAGDLGNGVPARTVHYADLNLDTQAGVAVLYKRIRYAAEEVCGDVGARDLDQAAAAKACVDRAILGTVHTINNPKLTMEYAAHVGGGQQKLIHVADVR